MNFKNKEEVLKELKNNPDFIIPGIYNCIIQNLLKQNLNLLALVIRNTTPIYVTKEDIEREDGRFAKSNLKEKQSEGDVFVNLKEGLVNIEANTSSSRTLDNKNKSYIGSIIHTHPDKKVYQVNLNTYDKFKLRKAIYHSNMKKDDEHIRWKNVEIIDVDIDSFESINYTNNEYEKEFIMFMKMLRSSSRKEIKGIIGNNKFMREVFMLHEKLCLEEPVLNYFTPEVMLEMERIEADRREKEGLKEGLKEGRISGIAEATLGLAKKMLKKGTDVSYISEITGLSRDKIKSL